MKPPDKTWPSLPHLDRPNELEANLIQYSRVAAGADETWYAASRPSRAERTPETYESVGDRGSHYLNGPEMIYSLGL